MNRYLHFSQQPEKLFKEIPDISLQADQSSEEWLTVREQACATLQRHTEELRQLMAQRRTFNHQTCVEAVMHVQTRSEALRWLIQAIEREIQRLDKGYREAAQREQFLQDQARLTAV